MIREEVWESYKYEYGENRGEIDICALALTLSTLTTIQTGLNCKMTEPITTVTLEIKNKLNEELKKQWLEEEVVDEDDE